MPVKIRLSRHGRKRRAFYHIIVADSRAPRDGKYIERIGSYNPNTNPATIDLDIEKALSWLQKGAQPTDTARNILSYKGVMMQRHLQKGVAKGALTQEQATEKFEAWLADKETRIQAKKDSLNVSANAAAKKRSDAETAVNTARAEAIAKRNAPVIEEKTAKKTEEKKDENAVVSAADKIDAALKN